MLGWNITCSQNLCLANKPTIQYLSVNQPVIIGASLSEPHTSEKHGVIVHAQKIRQKLGNLHVLREFNGVDYSASLYGSCYCPCHDKWTA